MPSKLNNLNVSKSSEFGQFISIHQTLSDHVAGVAGAPLPLFSLVLCCWLLAAVVGVAIIVIVMSDYDKQVMYGK